MGCGCGGARKSSVTASGARQQADKLFAEARSGQYVLTWPDGTGHVFNSVAEADLANRKRAMVGSIRRVP